MEKNENAPLVWVKSMETWAWLRMRKPHVVAHVLTSHIFIQQEAPPPGYPPQGYPPQGYPPQGRALAGADAREGTDSLAELEC